LSPSVGGFAQAAQAQTTYQTLNFGTYNTFLTGIRGNNVVGNYTLPDSAATGGLIYNMTTQTWSPIPVPTPNGSNQPGFISSSPDGASFGNLGGVLRVAGSYNATASAPYDLSYPYDAAAAPAQRLTTLVYPSTPGNETLFTTAPSTFCNQVVG